MMTFSAFCAAVPECRAVPLRWFQQKPFINDEEDRVGILGKGFLIGTVGTGHVELKEHVRQTDILCLVALFASFHAEGTGQVGLPALGSACDKQVPVFRYVFTGSQTLDKAAVELPPGSIVDVGVLTSGKINQRVVFARL